MEIAKFFHFFALMLGGAAGFGHLMLDRAQNKLGGPPPEHYKLIRPGLGMLGLVAILTLWITGSIMYQGKYAEAELGTLFFVKLAAAAGMLIITLYVTFLSIRAGRQGNPPPEIVGKLGKLNSPLALLALALAVYIFN